MKHSVEEVHLKNGAKGLLINIPGASVMTYQFQFRAGSRYAKSKDKYEAAHLMEHLAFGSNSRFNSEHEFEAEFAKNGAYHNAYTGDVTMGYTAECADFEWDRVLDLQGLSITEPKFKNAEFDAERGNVKNELTGYQNNYGRLLWPKIQQMLGEDVLSFNQRLKTLPNISVNDIREHYNRTHTSDNLRFVIAGKLRGRKTQIRSILENWDLKRGKRFDTPVDELKSSNPALIRRKDAKNLTFGWSTVLPRELSESEYDAMDCLNHILTGTMYSKILGKARKLGLVYSMFSDVSIDYGSSSWDFGGQVNYETAEALFDIIENEVKLVVNGKINESDVEASKMYAFGSHQMGAQTVRQINAFYAGRYFFDEHIKNYDRVPDKIKRISVDKISKTAQEFISDGIWAFATVGDCEKDLMNSLSDRLSRLYNKE